MSIWKSWLLIAALGVLAACSGSSSSGGTDDDSSEAQSSSSSGEVASSSSSVVIPAGARAATLEDIPRVVQFPDYQTYKVLYVFGASGVYSELYQDANGATKLQVVGSFNLKDDGAMSLQPLNCIIMESALSDLCDVNSTSSLIFMVEDSVLKAGKTEATIAEVAAGSLVEKKVIINKASDAVGEWKYQGTDTSFTLQFYSDLRFVLKIVNSNDDEILAAGNFDVQDGYLVGTVEYWNGSVPSLIMYKAVKNGGNLLLTKAGAQVADTLVAGTLPTSLPVSSLKTSWDAEKKSASDVVTHIFELQLLENSIVKLDAYDASTGNSAYTDVGEYQVFGDMLILDMNEGTACNGNGTIGIIGEKTFNCFAQIIGKAEINGTTLTFENDFIPKDWTESE